MLKQTLLNYLQHNHSDQFIKQWFEPLSITAADSPLDSALGSSVNFNDSASYSPGNGSGNSRLVRVLFPHQLFGQWFMMHARDDFENSVTRCLGQNARIEYVFDPLERNPIFAAPVFKKERRKNSPFSFSSFIALGDNYFALETAQGIARGSINLQVCNPFCLYGKSGCGKSHLLHSLVNELRNTRNMMVFMTTPNELTDIYRDGGSNYLTRQKILSHQAFVVDDLQQVKNKTELQDELVILFDHFYSQGKIIAFGCNCLPDTMEGLIFPLLTRLQQGVFAGLKQPDLELRSAFVRNRAKALELAFSDKQILSLSTQFGSLRQLEGIINRIAALSFAQGKKISDHDFEKMVKQSGGIPLSEVTSTRIIEVCSESLDISATDILGTKRSKEVSFARQVAMYLCRDLLHSSYPELGNIFGGKDQSTAIYSVKKVEQLLKADKDTNKLVTSLKSKCLGLKG